MILTKSGAIKRMREELNKYPLHQNFYEIFSNLSGFLKRDDSLINSFLQISNQWDAFKIFEELYYKSNCKNENLVLNVLDNDRVRRRILVDVYNLLGPEDKENIKILDKLIGFTSVHETYPDDHSINSRALLVDVLSKESICSLIEGRINNSLRYSFNEPFQIIDLKTSRYSLDREFMLDLIESFPIEKNNVFELIKNVEKNLLNGKSYFNEDFLEKADAKTKDLVKEFEDYKLSKQVKKEQEL